MRIGLLTHWANRANGGVFEAVATHANMLLKWGFSPHVFALAHPDDARDAQRFAPGVAVTTVPALGPKAIGYGQAMGIRLADASLDVLHLHGIWIHLSAHGADWAHRTGRPYVISPHGMLDPWIMAHGKVKKRLAKAWFEKRSWAAARAFHALTGAEARDIAAMTGRAETVVIPNGIAIPSAGPDVISSRTMLSIGRVHPKKNLLALVKTWHRAGLGAKGWRLVIAGWGQDEDVAALNAAIAAAGGCTAGIAFVGPVFGAEKERLLGEAAFVLLPSHSEGLPMAILEAWAAGVPTIMTDASHLPEGFEAGAAIRIGTDPDEIVQGLARAAALDDTGRAAMARAARTLAEENFSTDVIAQRWVQCYEGLVQGARIEAGAQCA